MKRLLTGALALLISVAASATTLNPVQLLNPTGSTSGQAVVSTGASTAPAWGNVAATALAAQAANTVVANVTASSASPTAFAIPSCSTSTSALQYTSGTGFTCYASSASLTGANTFSATQTVSVGGVALLAINDTGGSNQARITLENGGSQVWGLINQSTSNTFTVSRYVAGTLTDTPISVSNSTGAVTMSDGITGSPISGSTGSFTTLAATGNFTPSQTNGIVGTTTNNNANAGSVGEYVTNTTTGTSLTTNINANATSISLTAGDWDVSGICIYHPAASTQIVDVFAGITTTSATAGPTGTITNMVWPGFVPGATSIYLTSPTVRISLAATTTVYLLAQGAFTVSTETVDGFIRARRVR